MKLNENRDVAFRELVISALWIIITILCRLNGFRPYDNASVDGWRKNAGEYLGGVFTYEEPPPPRIDRKRWFGR